MAISSNLGFPRMGVHRELKKALEAYWLGKASETELLSVGKALRVNHAAEDDWYSAHPLERFLFV